MAATSYWAPQIAASALADAAPPLSPEFVVGTTLARLAVPLHALLGGWGGVGGGLSPAGARGLAVAAVLWAAAQAATLLAQARERTGAGWCRRS